MIYFLPIAFICFIFFFCYQLIIIPFCYIKMIGHKFALMVKAPEGHGRRNTLDRAFKALFFLVFGMPILCNLFCSSNPCYSVWLCCGSWLVLETHVRHEPRQKSLISLVFHPVAEDNLQEDVHILWEEKRPVGSIKTCRWRSQRVSGCNGGTQMYVDWQAWWDTQWQGSSV